MWVDPISGFVEWLALVGDWTKADWFEFARVGVAVLGFLGVILTFYQKTQVDRRTEWWKRYTWAEEFRQSDSAEERAIALDHLTVLVKSKLATRTESKVIQTLALRVEEEKQKALALRVEEEKQKALALRVTEEVKKFLAILGADEGAEALTSYLAEVNKSLMLLIKEEEEEALALLMPEVKKTIGFLQSKLKKTLRLDLVGANEFLTLLMPELDKSHKIIEAEEEKNRKKTTREKDKDGKE